MASTPSSRARRVLDDDDLTFGGIGIGGCEIEVRAGVRAESDAGRGELAERIPIEQGEHGDARITPAAPHVGRPDGVGDDEQRDRKAVFAEHAARRSGQSSRDRRRT